MKLDFLIKSLQEARVESSDGNVDVLFGVPDSKKMPGHSGYFSEVWFMDLRRVSQEDLFENLVICIG